MKRILLPVSTVILCLGCLLMPLRAAEETGTYRVVGLGTPDRQEVLREVMKEVPEVQIVDLDFAKAEIRLSYNVDTLFPGHNPKKPPTGDAITQRLDEKLRQASRGGFSIKPLSALPRDQLQRVDIKIMIPDCKGCRLGTYYAIAKIEGVEQVNLSTEPSQVNALISALIDVSKTNRDALVEALKKARVGFPPE